MSDYIFPDHVFLFSTHAVQIFLMQNWIGRGSKLMYGKLVL